MELVKAMRILCAKSFTLQQLNDAHVHLVTFVYGYELMYGEQYVSYYPFEYLLLLPIVLLQQTFIIYST